MAVEVLGAVIVKLTGMLWGVLVAPPVAVSVIRAEYVPADNPAVLTATVIGSVSMVVVPDAEPRVNQAALSLILQERVPPPVFVTLSVLAAGLAAP